MRKGAVVMQLTDEELDAVAGGRAEGSDSLRDLSNFITRTVCNVVRYDDTSCLTLRKTPNGAIIPGAGWQNGDTIPIHNDYTESGWYFAYDNKTGKFGFVNPQNIK